MLFSPLPADAAPFSGWFSAFVLALGAGTTGLLLLLPRAQLTPAFFRLHGWIGLALGGIAVGLRWTDFGSGGGPAIQAAWLTVGYCVLVFLQILAADWPKPSSILLLLATLSAGAGLLADGPRIDGTDWSLASTTLGVDLISAAFALGSANVAMLLGHWYLVGSDLPIHLLQRVILALGLALALRLVLPIALTIVGGHPLPESAERSTSEFLLGDGLFALMKLALGIALPGALTWMSYQCARLRSTMAATGILYVALVFVLVGELISTYLIATLSLPW